MNNNILPADPLATKFPNLGSIISTFLPYIYVAAGLLLLVMLISGGFSLLTSAGDQKKTAEGYGKITSGLIGFVIVFVSFFLVQIIEIVFGVKIF
jgi:uncharacterized membrane protein